MPHARIRRVCLGLLVSLLVPAGGCKQKAVEVERPNIVLIVADDLGIEGLASYGGSAYQTPNLDRLAAEGARFENAFATPLCIPSRLQLMTGQYPFRTGAAPHAFRRAPSLGKILHAAGYATAVAGKWQLTGLGGKQDEVRRAGFDEYSLWLTSGKEDQSRYWSPSIIENGRVRDDLKRDDVYGPDVFSNFLIEFIERNREKPFFIYYPMVLVHQPFTATPDDVEGGQPGVTKSFKGGSTILMSTHNAHNVAYMDKLVGRLLDALELFDLRRRTIVLFTADNGTSGLVASPRNGKRVWGGKGKMNDLGSNVPLIVNGPGVKKGDVRLELVDLTDLLPTIAQLAEAPLPEGESFDGRSFAPILRGEKAESRPWVYVQKARNWFIRDHRWRLHEDGQLYDVSNRFSARRVEPPLEGEAAEARDRLAGALVGLRPQLREVPKPSGPPQRERERK